MLFRSCLFMPFTSRPTTDDTHGGFKLFSTPPAEKADCGGRSGRPGGSRSLPATPAQPVRRPHAARPNPSPSALLSSLKVLFVTYGLDFQAQRWVATHSVKTGSGWGLQSAPTSRFTGCPPAAWRLLPTGRSIPTLPPAFQAPAPDWPLCPPPSPTHS